MKRDWLIYSESTDALFCIPCVLFSHGQKIPSHSPLNSDQGYKMCDVKWCRMYDKLPNHENNRVHRDCYFKWKNLQCSERAASGINIQMQRELHSEIERNKALLQRLLDVTLHLASRNVPFRGKTKDLGDVHNGNFLGTLELLSHLSHLPPLPGRIQVPPPPTFWQIGSLFRSAPACL